MRAVRAKNFGGYEDLELVEITKPLVEEGRVLVKVKAAGITPLDHTILFGGLAQRRRLYWEERVRAWWRFQACRSFPQAPG